MRRPITLVSGREIDNPFQVFARLARESGAECFFPGTAGGLHQAVDAVANDLQTQYTIGYYAEPSRKPWRRVEVKVNRHGLQVKARHGFSTVDAASALFGAGCAISTEQHPYPYERKLVHKDGHLIYREDFTDTASGWPETGAHSNGTDADNPNLGYKNEGYVHRGYVKDWLRTSAPSA